MYIYLKPGRTVAFHCNATFPTLRSSAHPNASSMTDGCPAGGTMTISLRHRRRHQLLLDFLRIPSPVIVVALVLVIMM